MLCVCTKHVVCRHKTCQCLNTPCVSGKPWLVYLRYLRGLALQQRNCSTVSMRSRYVRPGVRHLNIYVYTGKPAEHFVRDNKHIVESIKHMSCPITEHVVCNDTTCCVQSQNMWCAITQQVVCTQSTGNAHSSRTAGTAACSHLVKFHLQGRALDSRQPGPQNVRSQHSALDPAIASQPAEAAARHTHTHTH